jgi:hypothetical protein
VANDIDIIIGVKDLASAVLDKLNSKVGAMGEGSKAAFSGATESATSFLSKAASIAGTVGAFYTVYRAIGTASSGLANLVVGYNGVEQAAVKSRQGILSGIEPYAKMAVAAGALATITKSTMTATNATNGLITRVSAVARGALAAFVLKEALKKTEDGASTLSAKLAKVAATALAIDVVTRATIRFGLSLVGLGQKSDGATNSLTRTATAAKALAAGPLNAVKTTASSAAAATANLASKIDELPKGAQSVNSLVSSFGNWASQIGGVAGLLLSVPAAIAGATLAAITSANQTERQLTQLTSKLAIVEAAKNNAFLKDINTAPLRKVAEETEKVAKQIQTATNIQSSKLISLATTSLPRGLDTNQIGEALKAAAGLSEVYGTSVEDGMYRARQAMQGNFESFETLIPAIKTMTTDAEKMSAVSKLAANGFKVMAGESLTFWGTLEKVKNGLGNTLESLGRMRSLSDLVGTVLRDVVTPAVEYLDTKLKGFGFNGSKVLDDAKALGAGVIAAIETIGSNWSNIIERMLTSVDLFWVQLGSHAENFVTTTLPYVATNIVGIFDNAFAAVANNAKATFDYIVALDLEAIGAVPKGTAAFMKEENKRKPKFEPTPLPEMASRNISAKELDIQSKLAGLDKGLGDAFKKNFDKAFASLDTVIADQKSVFNIDLKSKAPPVAAEVVAEQEKKSKSMDTNLQAVQSRLLTRGPMQDSSKFIAQNTAQAAQTLKLLLAEQRAERERNRLKGRTTNLVVVGAGSVGGVN